MYDYDFSYFWLAFVKTFYTFLCTLEVSFQVQTAFSLQCMLFLVIGQPLDKGKREGQQAEENSKRQSVSSTAGKPDFL